MRGLSRVFGWIFGEEFGRELVFLLVLLVGYFGESLVILKSKIDILKV